MFEKIDQEEFDRICALPMVPFCEALLEREPKASSADLTEAWHAVHEGEPPIAKAEFKRVRDAWKERRTTVASAGEAVDDQAVQVGMAREQAWAQLEVAIASGNTKKQAELMKTLKGLVELAPEHTVDHGTEQWDRLTPQQRDCMLALVAVLNARPLDEDAMWWVELLARIPERPYETHPAHIPLPDAKRPAMLTP